MCFLLWLLIPSMSKHLKQNVNEKFMCHSNGIHLIWCICHEAEDKTKHDNLKWKYVVAHQMSFEMWRKSAIVAKYILITQLDSLIRFSVCCSKCNAKTLAREQKTLKFMFAETLCRSFRSLFAYDFCYRHLKQYQSQRHFRLKVT